HLHHHLLAARQARGVHLRDGCRRDRLLVDPGEGALERTAEILLDHPAHVREALRRDLVAAALELLHQLGREESLPRRHDLPELDVGGAKTLESAPEPARQPGARDGAARAALAQLPSRQRDAEERGGLREAAERRQGAAAHQRGNLGLRGGAALVDAGAPAQPLRVDGPRAVLAEGAGSQIRRRARCHTRDLPGEAPCRKRLRMLPAGPAAPRVLARRTMGVRATALRPSAEQEAPRWLSAAATLALAGATIGTGLDAIH